MYCLIDQIRLIFYWAKKRHLQLCRAPSQFLWSELSEARTSASYRTGDAGYPTCLIKYDNVILYKSSQKNCFSWKYDGLLCQRFNLLECKKLIWCTAKIINIWASCLLNFSLTVAGKHEKSFKEILFTHSGKYVYILMFLIFFRGLVYLIS